MALIIKEVREDFFTFKNLKKYSVLILALVVLAISLNYLNNKSKERVMEEDFEDPYSKFTAPEKGRKLTEEELDNFTASNEDRDINQEILDKFKAPE